mmetsp:Transcript_79398/g.227820  ORF Transcript_79398/g.227820 Transcript_79398/m.227820 type:complete len:974 (+) Transcript_79398:51-2972(+)
MKSPSSRTSLLLLGVALAAEPWSASAASLRLAVLGRRSASAGPAQDHGAAPLALDEQNATEVLGEPILFKIEQLSEGMSEQALASFRGRIRSKDKDWTKVSSTYMLNLLVPLLAMALSATTHKPELAACRKSGKVAEEEGGPSDMQQRSSVVPALLLVTFLAAAVPSKGAPWISAQVPLLFMVLGFGVGCQNPPKPLRLIAAAVVSYMMCLLWPLIARGVNPVQAALEVAEGLVPVEVFSSLPLAGVPQATACFGAVLACLALSNGMLRLSRGAGSLGLFYLWGVAMLGVFVDRDCQFVGEFLDPILGSLPSRLHLPSFAAGIIVSSMGKPSLSNRVLGLALAIAYGLSWQLPVSDVAWHAVHRGALLPIHAMMLWCAMDCLVVPHALWSAFDAAKSPALPVSFAVIFALPMLAARPASIGFAEGRVGLLLLVAVCHVVEWALTLVLDARDSEPETQTEIGPRHTFLGLFSDDPTIRNSLPFRLMQAAMYYGFLAGAFWYCLRGVQHPTQMWFDGGAEHSGSCYMAMPMVNQAIRTVGWSVVVVSGCVVIWNLTGMLLAPPTWRLRTPPAKELQSNVHDGLVLVFRYCTRGTSPTLVMENCEKMHAVLEESGLKKETWRLEVVTDNPVGLHVLAERGMDVTETLVPSSYKCPNGGKFKARAMHWAIANSTTRLRTTDWLCHLDEETYFDMHTVCAVYQHCQKQNAIVSAGEKVYPDCGQGTIMYNTFGLQPETIMTSLADTSRVGDDMGKFRFQFLIMGQAMIGMHGSFAVINQGVEEKVGFDFGSIGSITEDSYFAMKSKMEIDVGVTWIDGYMYEQSPFTVMDLIRQRGRWFHGLFYCTNWGGQGFSLRVTWLLSFMMSTWTLCFAIFAVSLLVRASLYTSCMPDYYLIFWTGCISKLFQMNYIIGFVHSFSPYLEGWPAWVCLFYFQTTILPSLIGLMEMTGVAHGLYLLFLNESVFYVVQKEKKVPMIK